jgi:CPA2 family monovalent cation:H+ antiporter-2
MEDIPLLRDIVILMVISVPMSFLLTRVGLPTVIGFLLTGVIVGPHGFGLVTEMHEVEVLAEIGIVLLLFTIGLEFSIKRMIELKREGLIGGGLQVALTTGGVVALGTYLGLDLKVSILLGFIVALSSTAIVLKLLIDKGDVNSAQGNLAVGVLLFQDIAVVLMVMIVQSIGGAGEGAGAAGGGGVSVLNMAADLGLSFAAFGVIVVAVGYLMPRIFEQVVKLRNREVFILSIVLVCLGTAWVTSLFGLSLALGAFIAGLAISESEYSNQIVAEVVPFRDTFSSLFFISIGMLLDVSYFIHHLPFLILLVAAVFCFKALVVGGVGVILRYPLRTAIIVGLTLAQIGEFSFILIKMGNDYGLLDTGLYQSFLAASILTMAITPFAYQGSSRLAGVLTRRLGIPTLRSTGEKETPLSNHVIIAGYGLSGKNLAMVLKKTAIAHLVVDINMARIREARKAGHAAHFGDLSHPEILKKMGVKRAKMLVVGISDPVSTRKMVKIARDIHAALTIIVRTRYLREVEELYVLGASQVIPEEFETSVEIFSRVLKDYRIPGNIIQTQIDLVRDEGYAMFRNPSISGTRMERLTAILETSLMDSFYVDGECSVAGLSMRDLDLRSRSGATVIAILRSGKAHTNPRSDMMIEPSDILVILGSHAELNDAFEMLKASCPLPTRE